VRESAPCRLAGGVTDRTNGRQASISSANTDVDVLEAERGSGWEWVQLSQCQQADRHKRYLWQWNGSPFEYAARLSSAGLNGSLGGPVLRSRLFPRRVFATAAIADRRSLRRIVALCQFLAGPCEQARTWDQASICERGSQGRVRIMARLHAHVGRGR